MTSKFAKFFVARDIFGQAITVNYKGSDAYRTKMGALCTILTYVLILINGISLVEGFLNGSKQSESAQTLFYDRFNEGKQSLDENQFSVFIATLMPISPRVGRILMRQYTEEDVYETINLIPCG